MEDKEALALLKRIGERYPLTSEEQEAVRTAIGLLAWTKLIEGRVKSIKKSRQRKAERDLD